MAHVLVPFADPRTGERAVRALLNERDRGSLSVELVAVVEPLTAGKVGIFLSDARAMATEAATLWLAPLEKLLADAQVPFKSTVAIGRLREVIRTHGGRPAVDRLILGVARRPRAAGRNAGRARHRTRGHRLLNRRAR